MTPAKAKILLEGNTNNRKIKGTTVRIYTDLMKRGLWKYNGQPIVTSNNQRLLDGQHRLLACVAANVSFDTEFIIDVASDTFDTIDCGAKRTFSDILSINKESDVKNKARVARVYYLYENGLNLKSGVPNTILNEFYYDNNIRISRACVGLNKFRNLYNPSIIGLAKIITTKEYVVKSDEFFDKLASGANLEYNDPILVLRNKLISITIKKADIRETSLRLILRAWTLSLKGKKITQLRITNSMK